MSEGLGVEDGERRTENGEKGNGRAEKLEGVVRHVSSDHPVLRSPFPGSRSYAVKLLPHPQPPVAFGLLKVKPEPCIELT